LAVRRAGLSVRRPQDVQELRAGNGTEGVEPLSEQPLEVLEVHGWNPTGHADRGEILG
jgi:hypothetical protein